MNRVLGCAIGLALCTAAVAQDVSIERLAPESAFLVAGVKNAERLCENMKNSPFWKMWAEGPLGKFMEQSTGESPEDMLKELDAALAEFELEREDIAWPKGAVGMAMYTVDDPETGIPAPAMLMVADFGANAEAFAKLFHKMLEAGVKNDGLTYETKQFAGREIYVIEPTDKSRQMAAQLDPGIMPPGGGMGGPPIPVPDIEDILGEFEKMHVVQSGNSWLVSSHEQGLVDTLELINADRATEFAMKDAVRGTMRHLGEQDAFGVFLMQPLVRMIAANEPTVMMVMPMVATFVGDIQSFGFGFSLDQATGSFDTTTSVFMPNGTMGLTSLVSRNAPTVAPPSFIGPSTISYTTMAVDFAGVMDVVGRIMAMLPMMGVGEQELQEMEMVMGPLLRALGSRMHVSSTLTRPITAESIGQLFALECKNQQEFESAFGGLALGMGLEPRDFLGHRIYSMDMDMMGMPMPGVPDSVGIGGGYVFLGNGASVEQALRSVGAEEVPSVVGEPLYLQSRLAIGDQDFVGWGFISLVDFIQMTIRQQAINMEQMIDQMRMWDPEMADEMAAQAIASAEMYEAFDFAALREYLGPAVWTMRAERDGFVMKSRLLPGSAE